MIADRTLRDVLAAFASPEPTPGGGSAAAMAAAVGTSLLMMVAALPKTRGDAASDRPALAAASSALSDLQRGLTEAIDADSAAYDQVVAAYRMPKATDEEKKARTAAVSKGLRSATEVPLAVMKLSVDAALHARAVAAHGNRAAASDIGVALELLQAGLEGARLNVLANLGGIAERAYADEVTAEAGRLAGRMPALVRDARTALE